MSLPKKYEEKIQHNAANIRIDQYLAAKFLTYSRSYFKKLIEKGLVTVNDRTVKPSYRLETGDVLQLTLPEAEETTIQPESIPLDILYEDAHLLVVNKPAGMVVHPGAGVHSGTLVNALLHHCQDLSGVGGRLRPGIVHRLDKHTSGVLVIAKNDESHFGLQKQFADKTVKRIYVALVWGILSGSKGEIVSRLNRSKRDRKKFVVAAEGKEAITEYEVQKYYEFLTLVRVQLKTGRTHQIRVHFNHIHHPVFGDPQYSGRVRQLASLQRQEYRMIAKQLLKILPYQALHATLLGFEHPITHQWMEFEVPTPPPFKDVLEILEKWSQSVEE